MAEQTPQKESTGMLSAFKTLGAVSGIGLEFAGLVVAGALVGRWLDGRWGSSPWFALVGIGVGVLLCGLQLWRIVVYLRKKEAASKGV